MGFKHYCGYNADNDQRTPT